VDDAVILLLGHCGLERLAEPLRALTGEPVTVGAWTQTELVERLRPSLVYVDLFPWDVVAPLCAAAVTGHPVQVDPGPQAAVVGALRGSPVVYRGLRRPSGGAFGLLPGPAQRALEAALARLAAVVEDEKVLDVGGLWARRGIALDDVRWGLGHGEPIEGAQAEAEWLHGLWRARTQGPVKCLVLDLDQTLIHGELVQDAFARLNPAYQPQGEPPGGTLLEGWWHLRRGLHEALRIVQGRGIALALATRNDPALVTARWRKRPAVADGDPGRYAALYQDLPAELADVYFAQHPQVLEQIALGPDDMVAIVAGFGAKSEACRQIAEQLGVGLESLAFLDDSAVEREEVRAHAPEVYVVEGDGPEAWREELLLGARFQVWESTPAAARRPASYRSRAKVCEAAQDPQGLGDFLQGLGLVVGVRPASQEDLPRVRELLQRTHQLDLTGRRPDVGEPAGIYVGWCRDRLADHGLVAAGIFREGRLEAWVCSCRVLPHRVAGTLLAETLRCQPEARVERVCTGRNGATVGLIEEARGGPAPWVRVEAT
jgi:FkbH-like protein